MQMGLFLHLVINAMGCPWKDLALGSAENKQSYCQWGWGVCFDLPKNLIKKD